MKRLNLLTSIICLFVALNFVNAQGIVLELPDNVSPGQAVEIPIKLGTEDYPVNNLMSITFSIYYDALSIEAEATSVVFDDSWIGDEGIDMDILVTNIVADQRLDIEISRLNIPTSGWGEISKIVTVMKEDLMWKNNDAAAITVGGIEMTDANGMVETLEEQTNMLKLAPAITHDMISVYPNPTADILRVDLRNITTDVEKIELIALTGQVIVVKESFAAQSLVQMNVSNFPAGYYILAISTPTEKLNYKISITN